MRITGGRARGIPLKAPKGDQTRPATDGRREALFAALGPRLQGAVVLDLFAGTGAYGLEAWSRGAATVSFVEKSRPALGCLRQNLAHTARSLALESAAAPTIHAFDVFRWSPATPPDFIVADPPYALLEQRGADLLTRVMPWLAPGGTLLLEAPGSFDLPPGPWREQRRQGKGSHQPSVRWIVPADADGG